MKNSVIYRFVLCVWIVIGLTVIVKDIKKEMISRCFIKTKFCVGVVKYYFYEILDFIICSIFFNQIEAIYCCLE